MAAPAISPVPRLTAFIMVSLGMFIALASSIALRRRALPVGSPPPRAATVNSLISRENILPRLASIAPFLCLIECHLECPDMVRAFLHLRAIMKYDCAFDCGLLANTLAPEAFAKKHFLLSIRFANLTLTLP